ncbi:hypothetical protein DBV05_g9701 [Lasiodiplodia theobromae]|uniref:F-box domain-containing protein n=1 Tax=Lasiodiplodia theobromae TaxID=45133 RepID=A0A5N5D1V9_9PEZI|nr:hypothetical protein DBV05_g9701 [Lasiodiplodia theobromae]
MSLSQPLEALPVELQLTLIGMLPLTALIRMRGVSKYWKTLIQANFDKPHVVHPTRRALLFVWETFISRPCFLKSRRYTLPLLKPFDREAYIGKLPTGTPLAFEMWIREWPSSAVIGWIWPGLDGKSFGKYCWCWWRTSHINRLSAEDGGPTVGRLTLEKPIFFGRDSVDAIHILKRLHNDGHGRDVMLALEHEDKRHSWSVVTSCKDSHDVGLGPFKRSETYPTWTSFLYDYINEIDEGCKDYYTYYKPIHALKLVGHQWTFAGDQEEGEPDDPVYTDADEGLRNEFRGDWCLFAPENEEVLFFDCPRAPGDMGGADPYDSDDSYEWEGTDGADGSEDEEDGEDA